MTMRRTLKRDIPQLLTQHKKKINGLCIAQEQWKAFSHQKILPLSHLSPFSSTLRPHNRPCVVTPRLELHSPCVQLWTIHKTTGPCDPAHFSHTLAPQIYWIGRVFSPVIDTLPDAVAENTFLAFCVWQQLAHRNRDFGKISCWWCVNWRERGFDKMMLSCENKISCFWAVLSRPRACGDVKFLLVSGVWWFIMKHCFYCYCSSNLNLF